jgi:predicted dehydrogenase
VNQAAQIARDRAVVVAVGTVGMELERQRYYEKELDFRVSRSYGPGRYDAAYEQQGRDYPIGHVRWTETRNMEAFLQFLADGQLDLKPLVTHRFAIDQARSAYDLISGATRERSLAVLFTYSESSDLNQRVDLAQPTVPQTGASGTSLKIGLLGAGSFATSILLPAIQRVPGTELVAVCTATGAHSRHAADKFKFRVCTTDERDVLGNSSVNTVVIATRHNLHANQVLAALATGKHVFCEKPLCLNEDELIAIVQACSSCSHARSPHLMVGFNRRFSPMALRMKQFLAMKDPLALHYRVNAGTLPPDHWINDPAIGGGRIVGEVCHFVDLLSFLSGALPIEVQARSLSNPVLSSDDVLISLRFENGSEGTIHYLASGDRSFSKERVEVFGGGAVAVLDDFRKLEMTRFGKKSTLSARWRQDKGHRGEWQAFAESVRSGGPAPIPFESIVSTTLTTFCIQKSRASGQPVIVDTRAFMQAALRNDS